MPYKPSNQDDAAIKLRADAAIAADAYNLTPDFFLKNKDRFEKIQQSVDSIVKSYGYNNKINSDMINPLEPYNKMLVTTLDRSAIQRDFLNQKPSNLSSGSRSIAQQDTGDNVEIGIINSFQKIVSESFSLMEEYRTAVSLIPELKRVIKLIVRDILNKNDVTKRALINVYKLADGLGIDESEEDVSNINKIIDEKITDAYRLEKKLPIWFYEALVSGAKPILVLPYKDIIKQAAALSKYNKKYGSKLDIKGPSTGGDSFSMEDLEECYNTMSFEDFQESMLPEINPFKIEQAFSTEGIVYEDYGILKDKYKTRSQEDEEIMTKSFEEFVDDVVDDNLVDTIYNMGMEELFETYKIEKQKADEEHNTREAHGMESQDDKIYETVNSIKGFIDKLTGENKEDDKTDKEKQEEQEKYEEETIKKSIRKNLGEFVSKIDKNINIIKDDYSALSLGKTDLYNRINAKKNNKKFIDGIYVEDPESISEIADTFDKEVLITELNPEFVIPVSIGSEHIQYYIYEADAYSGPTESPSRKSTSFANIVKSTGYGNDAAVISASNGVSLVPNDPALSSVFNPANFGNINMPLEGNDLLENNTRIEVMKQIVYKTLSRRMANPSLADNKTFKDAIVNLIRQGYIVQRQIKFTSVPATNVVYFAPDIDDKGMPHSILDGTLLQIYMYLAGIISMTMDIVKKSSDKEKLEVNMGMSKQIGMTLMEVQKQLSTRNIHVRSFFDNIGSVLRNVSTYARYTIPVVEGEKLYDVNTVESRSESPIDTDFIERRLTSILNALPCPPSITNMLQESEFSRGLLNQNIEYRNATMDRQGPLSEQTSKLYKLIAMYMKLTKPLPKDIEGMQDEATTSKNDKIKLIDIKNIKVEFSPPMALNMQNIAESFTNVETVIEQFSKYLFGENPETKLEQVMVNRFKKECLKRFATNIDFSEVESIADKIKANPLEGMSDDVKLKIIGNKSENILSGQTDEGSSGGGSGGDDSGFGGF